MYLWNKTLHVSDSSSVHHQQFFTVHTAMVNVIQACWQLASRIRAESFLKFIFGIKLHVSDHSSVHHQEFFTVHTAMVCHTGLVTACEQDQDGTGSQIYLWNKTLHVSDSSSVHHQEFSTVHTAMVYVIHVWWQLASRIRAESVFKFIFGIRLYMFLTVPLSIISSFPLYKQQ